MYSAKQWLFWLGLNVLIMLTQHGLRVLRMAARALWRSEACRIVPWSETLHEPQVSAGTLPRHNPKGHWSPQCTGKYSQSLITWNIKLLRKSDGIRRESKRTFTYINLPIGALLSPQPLSSSAMTSQYQPNPWRHKWIPLQRVRVDGTEIVLKSTDRCSNEHSIISSRWRA